MKPFCIAVILALASCSSSGKPPSEKDDLQHEASALPNIVLFSIDTLRADHLGLYGYDKSISPRIDAFGRESVVFNRAVSQAPSTAPSHMSLLTGLTPAVHRVLNVDHGNPDVRGLDSRITTFPERLQNEGYYTVGLHGGGNMDKEFGFDRGFDFYSQDFISFNWIKAHKSPGDLDVIRHWLRIGKDRDRSLFLFLHHYVCHAPYVTAPEALRERFLKGKKVEGLPTGMPDADMSKVVEHFDRIRSNRSKLKVLSQTLSDRFRSFWSGVDLARPDHRSHIVALYDAGVSYADLLFGRVRVPTTVCGQMSDLKRKGRAWESPGRVSFRELMF